MAFRGTFDHSLDAKNRVTVPAKFRAALSDGVVLAKGIERCVAVWPPSAYDRYVEDAVERFPPVSAERRKVERFFAANAFDAELDAAGRIMVPPFLVDHAGLRKECVVAGAGGSLEVWDRASWSDYNAALTSDVSEITARLGHPG